MNPSKQLSIEPQDVPALFNKIEKILAKKDQIVSVLLLGGLAIILQNFRMRATLDIDIAPSKGAELFAQVCSELNIPVDIVTMVTTVDLNNCETVKHYQGKYLKVSSISAQNLIKTKLERFYKQDPQDIYAILDRTNLSYIQFQKLFKEMLKDYVGNTKTLKLSALEVVERKYPEHLNIFKEIIRL